MDSLIAGWPCRELGPNGERDIEAALRANVFDGCTRLKYLAHRKVSADSVPAALGAGQPHLLERVIFCENSACLRCRRTELPEPRVLPIAQVLRVGPGVERNL